MPTALSAGDIAIIGINSDFPDTFSFVLNRDIEAGTVINFTDKGWRLPGAFSNFAGNVLKTSLVADDFNFA
jgi:hypothetical protein